MLLIESLLIELLLLESLLVDLLLIKSLLVAPRKVADRRCLFVSLRLNRCQRCVQSLLQREALLLRSFAYEQSVDDVERYLQNATERQTPAEHDRPVRIRVDAVVLDRFVFVDAEREDAGGDQRCEVLPAEDEAGADAEAEHLGEVAFEAFRAVEPGDHGRLEEAHPQQANSAGAVIIEELEHVHAALYVGGGREKSFHC